jgi:hypothetical protein
MGVFVLNKKKQPLMSWCMARSQSGSRIAWTGMCAPVRVKVDPRVQGHGNCAVDAVDEEPCDTERGAVMLNLFELERRDPQIHKRIEACATFRRRRRCAHLRQ